MTVDVRTEIAIGGVELVPDERLVMRTAERPFPMETTHAWADAHRLKERVEG